MSRITIVQTDDWAGLYRDDQLVYEGHSIHPEHLKRFCGVEYDEVMAYESWPEDLSRCENSLKDMLEALA